MKLNFFSLTDAQRAEISARSACRGWTRLKPEEAPSFLPESLRARAEEVVEVVGQSSTGGIVVLYNIHRVDAPARALDHTPFVVVVHSTGVSTVGHFVHHGDWEGRTTAMDLPRDSAGEVTSSGVAAYYRAQPPSGKLSGSLSELRGGDAAAFGRVMGLAPWRISAGSEESD